MFTKLAVDLCIWTLSQPTLRAVIVLWTGAALGAYNAWQELTENTQQW